MRICYFGTFEAGYDRNRILIQGLRELGHDVDVCHEELWQGSRHKTAAATSPAALLGLSMRLVRAYAALGRRYLRREAHDVVIVGYLGHLDVFPARLLSWLRNEPLVFDAFISLHDTLVGDRAVVRAGSLPARLLELLDTAACGVADRVLLDTDAHVDYFVEAFRLDRSKFQRVLVGADPSFFYRPSLPTGEPVGEKFSVLHYSKFAPLHGLSYMLQAAKLLEADSRVEFLLVGGGQMKEEVGRMSAELRLTNVRRVDWMTPDELRVAIAEAGACLGIFGDTAKASRVIPNKVYQCMAVGGAIVTRDSPGIRELLRHEENALLCPPADPEGIAEAIARLLAEPQLRQRIGTNAREVFRQRCQPAEVCRPLEQLLPSLRQ